MPEARIYLDHAATTPLLHEAREAYVRALGFVRGNPSSPHLEGRAAKDALEEARTSVAESLGCRPREVVFTSGATEAAQIGLYGAAIAGRGRGSRLVVSAVEHPAVMEAAEALGESGFDLVRVPVDEEGVVSSARFLAAVTEDTAVAALMLANHETGAVMPVAEVARGLRERGVPLLCDASLGAGRLPVGADELGADLVVHSAHKCNGPVGAGALYVRRRTRVARWMRGGVQEEKLRPGTENVAACAAFAVALRRACAETPERARRYDELAVAFLDEFGDEETARRVGPATGALPGLLTLELPGVEGEAAMINMDLEGYAVSTGSTCALGSSDPSPGLLAMGMSRSRASSTIRITVGEGNDDASVRSAASSLRRIVSRLRALAH